MTLESLLEQHGYTSLPLTRTLVGQLGIDAAVNGRAARFLVDTGASATVIDRQSAAQWSLTAEGGPERAAGCVGGAGEAKVEGQAAKVTLGEMRLASLELSNIPVFLVDLSHVNAELEKKGAGRIDGVLGGDLLDQRHAVIAYASRTLHLKQ